MSRKVGLVTLESKETADLYEDFLEFLEPGAPQESQEPHELMEPKNSMKPQEPMEPQEPINPDISPIMSLNKHY